MTAVARDRFLGYRRENGRVGVRNHVVVLPVDPSRVGSAELGQALDQPVENRGDVGRGGGDDTQDLSGRGLLL